MAGTVNPSEIFDRARRRIVRDRAWRRTALSGFLHRQMIDEIMDRLTLVNRDFSEALIVGTADQQLCDSLSGQGMNLVISDAGSWIGIIPEGVQCDEDRLPFADQSFDLVINVGTLDTVNDLPGALALTRRVLRPDGLFLGAFFGAGSLPVLKSVLMKAEADQVSPHIHPQIDVRTAGDLMSRAGLALPVADSDRLEIHYSSLDRLVSDLRDHASTNILREKGTTVTKAVFSSAQRIFDQLSGDGKKTIETIEIVHLSGWAPHPDQPKPARRGSAEMSLKEALSQRSES